MARLRSLVDVLAAFCLIVLLEYKSCVTERVERTHAENGKIAGLIRTVNCEVKMTSARLANSALACVRPPLIFSVAETLTPQWHFYFYELLTNVYKPTFVEMHFGMCDLILKDQFFGSAMKRSLKTCPLPAGRYHLYNMTIPVEHIPAGFPFSRGRIYVNCTLELTKELVASGHIDIELKQYTVKKDNDNQKGKSQSSKSPRTAHLG